MKLPRIDLPTRPWAFAIVGALILVFLALSLRNVAILVVSDRLHREAAQKRLWMSWRKLDLDFPARVSFSRLLFTEDSGDTTFRAESLSVTLNPWSLVTRHPRLDAITLSHARFRMRGGAAEPDTLSYDDSEDRPLADRSERLKHSADALIRLLLAPARNLPSLTLRDVVVETPPRDDAMLRGARLVWLALRSSRGGIHLAARGSISGEGDMPFELMLDYGRDDRISGGARFLVPSTVGKGAEPLRFAINGSVAQDPSRGIVSVADSTRMTIGGIPFFLSGSLSRAGPHVKFNLAADGLTESRIVQGLPRAMLGPLTGLSVTGSFDYRLGLDLDLARPDSVDFFADVIPHDLRLDPAASDMPLTALNGPFTARIHLPHHVIATREMSPANPHYRPLGAIDSLITAAVVTNEDGGFFRHRGFNTEAVKMAIATNIHAGAYRRGAGTITMQLVRNLYLGHERTLSRKAQEVVLAWVLEHLTGVPKRRLLEIYLNIIEWGPGVHGADEAASYYFGHDAGHCTVDEALFLSTVVPAPTKWMYRFDRNGDLRRFARAQMHFIGRAMVGKGWLAADQLPPRDSLRVQIRGPAHAVLYPSSDSLSIGPDRAGPAFRAEYAREDSTGH